MKRWLLALLLVALPSASFADIFNPPVTPSAPLNDADVAFCPPQATVFLSGSGTYTTPTCSGVLPLYLEIYGAAGMLKLVARWQ